MGGFALKKVARLLAGIECNGCNKSFASMTSTDEVMLCTELRVVHYLTYTRQTCMQSADQTCSWHHCSLWLLCRHAHRTRGGAVNTTRKKPKKHTFTVFDIQYILHIWYYFAYSCFHTRPHRCGEAGCENEIFCILYTFNIFLHMEMRGCLFCICFCIFGILVI